MDSVIKIRGSDSARIFFSEDRAIWIVGVGNRADFGIGGGKQA